MHSTKATRRDSKLIEISFVAVLTAVMISLLVPAARNLEENSTGRQHLASAPAQNHFVSKNKSVPHRIERSRTERM